MVELWRFTVKRIYIGVTMSNNGTFITMYTFMFPLMVLYISEWILPHFQFPVLGLTMVYCVPIFCCFWKDSFKPFGRLWPWFSLNTSLFCCASIMFGQLFCIMNPERLPLFPVKPSSDGEFIIENLTGGVILERDLHAICIMAVAHGAYYLFGFFVVYFRKELPPPPLKNMVFMASMCIFYISLHTLSFSPSKDFFYLTAGYVTYHQSTRRFWYHFGGWSLCVSVSERR